MTLGAYKNKNHDKFQPIAKITGIYICGICIFKMSFALFNECVE